MLHALTREMLCVWERWTRVDWIQKKVTGCGRASTFFLCFTMRCDRIVNAPRVTWKLLQPGHSLLPIWRQHWNLVDDNSPKTGRDAVDHRTFKRTQVYNTWQIHRISKKKTKQNKKRTYAPLQYSDMCTRKQVRYNRESHSFFFVGHRLSDEWWEKHSEIHIPETHSDILINVQYIQSELNK